MGARRTGGEVRAAVEGDEHGGEPGSPGVGSEDWRCLVCRLKEGTEANDMSHVQHVIRFIAGYVEPPLPIDVQSVFRRSVVDGYINHLIATGRERAPGRTSISTTQSAGWSIPVSTRCQGRRARSRNAVLRHRRATR